MMADVSSAGLDNPTGAQTAHGRRVEFLDALAILMGCEGTLNGELPDGRRPDVLRYDVERRILFIGDAKHWETPGNRETQARLQHYFKWLRSHVEGCGLGIFAVCFGRRSDTSAWTETMEMLGREVGLYYTRRGVERFGPGLLVAWSEFSTSAVG
jgi:hypothetical protein